MQIFTQANPITDFKSLEANYKTAIETISVNGPEEKDYPLLANFFQTVFDLRKSEQLADDEIKISNDWFLGAFKTSETLQGHVNIKPHGYDGDYQIIDNIYRSKVSHIPKMGNWDKFFYKGVAPQAVKNRKEFFLNLLKLQPEGSKILNLASGPCTDLLEFAIQSDKYLQFHNIDLDANAIAFAKSQLHGTNTLDLEFEKVNVFKFIPSEQYDLIWSAGLFDYFDDKIFKKLLTRFSKYVKPGGKMVIGNFSHKNTSRAYMEYGFWFLNHRDEKLLQELGKVDESFEVSVHKEPLGVNLFLTLTKK